MSISFLLIDDNPIDLLINEKIIKSYRPDSKVTKMPSGTEALSYLMDQKATAVPDVILLDIKMPLMNGFQFLEEYKKLYNPDLKQTRLYMLSSSIDPEDIRRCEEDTAVVAFLEKPLKMDHLQNRISVDR